MKIRHVYSTVGIGAANRAIQAAREAGIADRDISLVARDDISMDRIPDDRKLVMNDFYPAALRGAVTGGASGLIAGMLALVTPIGLTIAGVGAMALIGVATGAWVSALVGSSVPDVVHREFEQEIREGKILIVIDGDVDTLHRAHHALMALGARHLDFHRATALT
ncbi:hypothetical protein [Dyella kyungheensis]|jgi:uncharacterized membrane protein|uniref:DUF1269 domain-containing protein n=1 Tax=Dyella kyungheensis TaxID=1242174 RepID=A0ABS2JLH5_9GAMM|nr:hypothetical protein [Dyella kyungheensis]MBM7119889.1 hypothetical protein [Dyella kyungheensis]